MDRRVHDGLRDLNGAAVRNPLRSEADAFRLLLYVIAVFSVIIAAILIARAV